MDTALTQLIVFKIDIQEYALSLSAIERVVRAVEITPLINAPELLLGLVNIEGDIIPVINMRRCFNLEERDIEPNDQMIIANTSCQKVCLWIDSVTNVIELPENKIAARENISNASEDIKGAVICDDGMILIYNLDKLAGSALKTFSFSDSLYKNE
ncbi:chemotaxis protein CheW [Desulfobacterales bacterium HSG17]|nr:chemotaxis protein CheW [Desulfobacterales bacterium HSG17]